MRNLRSFVICLAIFYLSEEGNCGPTVSRSAPVSDYPNDDDYNDVDYGKETETYTEPEGPSYIISKETTLSGRIGETVTFPCEVANIAGTVVSWLRDNEMLYVEEDRMVDDTRFQRLPNNSLVIHNLTVNDEEKHYTCRILTKPPQEIVHTLRVPVSKSLEIVPKGPIYVDSSTPNAMLTVRCRANWMPAPNIVWSFKGTRLATDLAEGIHIGDDGMMTIRNVSMKHSGLYQCLAEIQESPSPQSVSTQSALSKPVHAAVEVILMHAPRVEVETPIVHTGPGSESELVCRVDAFPMAKVTWFKKNGKEVVHDEGTVESSDIPTDATTSTVRRHVLTFENTLDVNLGTYECRAKNQQGVASGFVVLTGVPSTPKLSRGFVAEDGVTPIAEWTLQSYSPILEYRVEYRRQGETEWLTANPPVENAKSTTWEVRHPLKGLSPGAYEVTLLARNTYGWAARPAQPDIFVGEEAKYGSGANSQSATTPLILGVLSVLITSAYHNRFHGAWDL